MWYGPDTYMGRNLAQLFTSLAQLSDEEVQELHPAHTQVGGWCTYGGGVREGGVRGRGRGRCFFFWRQAKESAASGQAVLLLGNMVGNKAISNWGVELGEGREGREAQVWLEPGALGTSCCCPLGAHCGQAKQSQPSTVLSQGARTRIDKIQTSHLPLLLAGFHPCAAAPAALL